MASTYGLDPNAITTQTTDPVWQRASMPGFGSSSWGSDRMLSPGTSTQTYSGPGGQWTSDASGSWRGAGGQLVGDLSGYLKMKGQQQTGADFSGYQNQLQGLLSDPSKIQQTAGYQFQKGQGEEAINRSAAAKGMLGSGNVLAELAKYGQGMASQEYGNQVNRLADLMRGAQQFGLQSGYYEKPQSFASGAPRTMEQGQAWYKPSTW